MIKRPVPRKTILLVIAVLVWGTWLLALGPQFAFSNVVENWRITLTMVFGSMIAGATSVGGGAVAFPVFTKVLQIPPADAKVFSLAIQSVGMTAATITIWLTGIQVDWRIVRWGSVGGAFGIATGMLLLAPSLPPDVIKMSFSVMLASFAVTLLMLHRESVHQRHTLISSWSGRERSIILVAGFLGGIMSGLVGNGIDIFIFAAMVLLFRVCERVATPTSVILMAFNAAAGLFVQVAVVRDFAPPVTDYWLAAVPVVVIGAPLGAIICSLMSRTTIANVLIGLILVELLSSLFIIQLRPLVLYTSLAMLVVFSTINYLMYRTRHYEVRMPGDLPHAA
mgnify:CR=1 FL=1